MYLYPQQGLSNLTNYCVPDCPTVNFQMVNNPILGRCEFLGYYCMYGNYIDGCKRPYLENSNYLSLLINTATFTLQNRITSGLDFTYGSLLGSDSFM